MNPVVERLKNRAADLSEVTRQLNEQIGWARSRGHHDLADAYVAGRVSVSRKVGEVVDQLRLVSEVIDSMK